MVQPLQPARGSTWGKPCVDGWRAPKNVCLVTCIQCQRKNLPLCPRKGLGHEVMRQMQMVLSKASWFVCFWESEKCLSRLASSRIAAAFTLPSSLPGARGVRAGIRATRGHSKGQCQMPALVPSHALAGLGLSSSLPADAARGWTAATGPAHTAGFVLGTLGKIRVKKEEEERLLHPQKEKEGEHDSKDKAPFKPTSKHCLLLILKVERRDLAHPWAARRDSPPWLTDGLWLGFLTGVSRACGKMGWNSG